jgi:hypothetical protein
VKSDMFRIRREFLARLVSCSRCMSEGRHAVSAESGGAGNNNFAIPGRPSSGLVGGVVTGSVIAQHRSDPIHVVEGTMWRIVGKILWMAVDFGHLSSFGSSIMYGKIIWMMDWEVFQKTQTANISEVLGIGDQIGEAFLITFICK